MLQPALLTGPLRHAVALAAGWGGIIVLLQALALAGALRPIPVLAVLAAGLLLALVQLAVWPWRASLGRHMAQWRGCDPPLRLLAAAVLALAVSTLLWPLAPPQEWDELMYHLPHAAQWAESGRLTVNGWLRYPWFPYNYNLLYAAALLFGNDILPHLMHAAAAWIAALLLLAWGGMLFGAHRALLAVAFWLLLARSQLDNAYVDLGVALFVFFALVAMERWRAVRETGWLVLCAFAFGVAAGSKYQALAFAPFFAAALWGARPTARQAATALLALLLPCAYWYGRNLLLAGDPVAPLGGQLFGFTDWNPADLRAQLADLRRVAELPPWLLWPALLPIAIQLLRGQGAPRLAAGYGAWALLTWAASSRYPRYLLPAYPVLALMAVLGWEQLLRAAAAVLRLAATPGRARLAAAALCVAAVGAGAADLARAWRGIAPTPAARDALLSGKVSGHAMWKYLQQQPRGRIYQFGLEDAIYYAPRPIHGEVFGPWRYADYAALEPGALRQRLASEGIDALVVHSGRFPHVIARPGFARHFALERQEGPVMLFTFVRPPPQP